MLFFGKVLSCLSAETDGFSSQPITGFAKNDFAESHTWGHSVEDVQVGDVVDWEESDVCNDDGGTLMYFTHRMVVQVLYTED